MRRLLILNLALFALLIGGAMRFHRDWIVFEATHQPDSIRAQRETLPQAPAAATAKAAVVDDWTDIASRNPFSFERTDGPIVQPVPPPKPPGAKPILFGTITLNGQRLAMVGPGGRGGNRSYKSMKVGEEIDGWTITEIQDKSVKIKADTLEDSVIMNDPSAKVPRDSEKTAATAAPPVVVSTPPSPALTPAPSAALTPSQPAAQPTPGRRRIRQITPFGVREIEVDEQ